jgi:hypothetical protein
MEKIVLRNENNDGLSVLTNPQTYRNIAYLLLAFPLGIFYFVFLITGISLGVSLSIIWIGIPMLIGVLWLSRSFAKLERRLTNSFLQTDIMQPSELPSGSGFWQSAKRLITSEGTWAEVFYLFSKFILGTLSFTLVISLLATSVGLMVTPFFWNQWGWNIGIPGVWEVDSFSKAAATAVVGAILGIGSLYFINEMARVYGEFTKAILEIPAIER